MLNSLIGIIASSGGAPASLNSYESIATVNVGAGGATSISFTSIPSTYQHLQIRNMAREKPSGDSLYDSLYATFNSDTGSNYSQHFLRGNGSAAQAGGSASQTSTTLGGIEQGGNAANIFGAGVIDVLDYANTSKYKTVRSLFGYDANGSGYIVLASGLWQSTSAITSITMTPVNGIAQYSSFALYGIKG